MAEVREGRSGVLASLEAKGPRGSGAIVVLLAMLLAVRGGRGDGVAVECAWGGAMALFAGVVALGGRARVADLALGLAPAMAGAMAGVEAFGFADPLAPFDAQEPGGRAMLTLRVFVLALAFVRIPTRAPGATPVLATLGAIFLGTLAAHGLVPVLVLASALALRRFAPRDGARAAPPRPWVFALLALLPILAFVSTFRREAVAPQRSLREQVEDWRARENLFRARAVALEWATHEDPPGEAHLALASVDWDLGHAVLARKVLGKVLAHPASDEAQRQATALAQAWGDGSP